ncbi:NERD domain-containing protein [Metabacillus sp. KIGAM252]|uniref:NERD domain-containing protein n=1 Tax=Metabacillus flavus TaxID=2823519 RepID=A0ABS5LI72_9BACI|nr:nuclease-related domain-containing protein [Metabacillus flavus]MBS2970069.1 NERD domain-containing protein [Metabacillus flavus]
MGQLIKLRDYISRYEIDPYHYTGQYIRLKKHQWERINKAWEERQFDTYIARFPEEPEKGEEKSSFWGKWTFRKQQEQEEPVNESPAFAAEEDPDLLFTHVPASIDELKHEFLDKIYRFQLKWASSTIREQSDFDRRYFYDETLQFFLKRLPDHNLYMHNAVLEVKNAAVEIGPVLITPAGIQCISWIQGKKEDILVGSGERFWTIKSGKYSKKTLNPLLDLHRTSTIIKKIIESRGIDFPVMKRLIFEHGYADFQTPPYDVEVTDKRSFNEWLSKMRNLSSPVKHDQLKAVKALLDCTLTRSRIRSDWEDRGN